MEPLEYYLSDDLWNDIVLTFDAEFIDPDVHFRSEVEHALLVEELVTHVHHQLRAGVEGGVCSAFSTVVVSKAFEDKVSTEELKRSGPDSGQLPSATMKIRVIAPVGV